MPCRNGLDRSCRSSGKCGKWCTYRVRQVGWRLGARSSDRCLFSALSPASVSSRVRCDPAASGLHQDGRGGKGPWEGLETPGQYQTAQGRFKIKVPHRWAISWEQVGHRGGGGCRAPLTLGTYFLFQLVRTCSRRVAGVLRRGGTLTLKRF